MDLIDTHCHIQSIGTDQAEDHTVGLWQKSGLTAEQVIESATKADVKTLICVGCDVDDSLLAVNFVKDKPSCWASIGIHPHEAGRYVNDESSKMQFNELASAPKVIAIGECGLDYFYTHSKPQDQAAILRFQLDLAVRSNLPVIFHVRNAFSDFWPIFDSYGGKIRGVLHSFTDSSETLNLALERGLYIGINGIATFAKDDQQKEMYRGVPLDRLILETDSPYLTPAPYRGTINEPKHIRTVAEFLVQLRGEGLQQIADASTTNARLLFGL